MSKTQKSVMTSTSFKALKKALKTVFVFETEKKLRTLWWSQKYDVNFIFTTDFFQVFQVLPCCFKDQTPLLMTNNLWQNVLGVEIKESTLIVHICESSSSSSLAKRVQHVGNIQRQVKELHYHFDREKDMKNIQILMKWMNFLADPRTFEALDQAQSLEVIEYIERKPRVSLDTLYLVVPY
jgi:hypothetical protein